MVPTTTAAASERRGTPGATQHCQITRHLTIKALLADRRSEIAARQIANPHTKEWHQTVASPARSLWHFAAPVLHVDDRRPSWPQSAIAATIPSILGEQAC